MPVTSLSICQSALTRIGATPIASFTEGSAEAIVAESNYSTVKRAVIAMYPWRCSMETRQLVQRQETPYQPWLYAWQKPADAIKLWAVRSAVDGEDVDFEQQGDKLLTVEPAPLVADFGFEPGEAKLEPHVVEMIVLRLASLFAIGVADRASMSATLQDEADFYFRFAKTADAQGRTTPRIRLGRYTRVRR